MAVLTEGSALRGRGAHGLLCPCMSPLPGCCSAPLGPLQAGRSGGSCWVTDARPVPSSAAVFEEPEDPSNRSFFSEIISSISDVKFSHSGRYIMTRDYLTVKVWDLNMENRPIETYQVGVGQSRAGMEDGSGRGAAWGLAGMAPASQHPPLPPGPRLPAEQAVLAV